MESRLTPKGRGMKRRIGIAQALLGRPQLIIVDDLSSALDVNTERLLWERLFALTGPGKEKKSAKISSGLIVNYS